MQGVSERRYTYPHHCRGRYGPHLIAGPDDEVAMNSGRTCKACDRLRRAAAERERIARDPVLKARNIERLRAWQEANSDRVREIRTDAMRRWRESRTEEQWAEYLTYCRNRQRAKADERAVARLQNLDAKAAAVSDSERGVDVRVDEVVVFPGRKLRQL